MKTKPFVAGLLLLFFTLPLFGGLDARLSYHIHDTPVPLEKIRPLSFAPLPDGHFNLGFSTREVWVRIDFVNAFGVPVSKVVSLDNPLLEKVTLISSSGMRSESGMLDMPPEGRDHLVPAFFLEIPPGNSTWWLRIRNGTTALQFGLSLDDPSSFLASQHRFLAVSIFLLGIVVAFLLLSLALYGLSRERIHLYYAFYLVALLFQQTTYIGLLPLWAPSWFTRIDDLLVVPKLAVLIIAATLYAREFLGTKRRFPMLERGYGLFLVITAVVALSTAWPRFYLPQAIVFTGLFFVIFNLFAGVYAYRHGFRAARFFIAAWVVLTVGYLMMIVDALGWYSIMYRFPSMLLLSTALEAILLILAVVDRYRQLRAEKERLEAEYTKVLEERNRTIQEQVSERTRELAKALKLKETLYRELNHRVKNNLQFILSLIRLQKKRLAPPFHTPFDTLERRISTIAKTHEMFCENRRNEEIDMGRYLLDIARSLRLARGEDAPEVRCRCDLAFPMREAVYLGLIANELLTNFFKYASGAGEKISMWLHREERGYRFEIEGPAGGPKTAEHREGLGLVIVETLTREQLGGTLDIKEDYSSVTIRFPEPGSRR